jgi:hypothetical protein
MAIAGFKQIFGNQLQTRESGGKSGRSMFITAGNGYDMLRQRLRTRMGYPTWGTSQR